MGNKAGQKKHKAHHQFPDSALLLLIVLNLGQLNVRPENNANLAFNCLNAWKFFAFQEF